MINGCYVDLHYNVLITKDDSVSHKCSSRTGFSFLPTVAKTKQKRPPLLSNDAKRFHCGGKKRTRCAQTAFLSDRLHSIVLNAIGQRRVFRLKNCIVIWGSWCNWFNIKGIGKNSFGIGNFY